MRSWSPALKLPNFALSNVERPTIRLPSLGSVNLVLLSLYFIPVWGREAVRALISPYNGLEDRAQAAAAIYFGGLFDLGSNGLIVTSHVLAGIKLVITAAFVSYVIEFARGWVTRREPDRETIDIVLILAVTNVLICLMPALMLGDAAMVRPYATQMLLIAGAITVIIAERHAAPASESPRAATTARDVDTSDVDTPRLALPVGVLAAGPPPASAAAALARIPESRLRI